jgi:hypothetical protein
MVPGFMAHIAFWVVLIIGARELGARRVAVFVVLWVVGYVASDWFMIAGLLFLPYIAILDIVLVLMVFKGDVPLR